jgi:hypothetical protein
MTYETWAQLAVARMRDMLMREDMTDATVLAAALLLIADELHRIRNLLEQEDTHGQDRTHADH